MRAKCDAADEALREERARNEKAGWSDVERTTTTGRPTPEPPAPPATTTTTTTAGTNDLPPFAAALFAHAEQEEREKRSRRRGKCGPDDGPTPPPLAATARGEILAAKGGATANGGFDGARDDDTAGGTPSVNVDGILVGASGEGSTLAAAAVAEVTTTTGGEAVNVEGILVAGREGSTVDGPSSAADATETAREDTRDRQIRELAAKCAQLTRQQEVLERKLALSQADRVMDSQSKEEMEGNARHAKERDRWERRRTELEAELEGLRGERDGLAARLEDRGSVREATRLLFGLMRERLSEVVGGVAGVEAVSL